MYRAESPQTPVEVNTFTAYQDFWLEICSVILGLCMNDYTGSTIRNNQCKETNYNTWYIEKHQPKDQKGLTVAQTERKIEMLCLPVLSAPSWLLVTFLQGTLGQSALALQGSLLCSFSSTYLHRNQTDFSLAKALHKSR